MPLQNSGTINLSDVIEEFGIGSNNSAQVFTTAGTGTVTAPVTGYVVIEVLGAGGGGGGSTSGSYNGGGGGSGAWAKELVYINAGETLNYVVGSGGYFGEGPGGPSNGEPGEDSYVYSGTKTITTIRCGGGFGGTTAIGSHGTGGSGGSATNANTNIGLSFTGNGGLDGDSSPSNFGTSPEQISGATNAGNGGAGLSTNGFLGQNGAVKFTWYETTKNLRGYLKAANTNVAINANNANIPTSGTIELRDFIGATAVGFASDPLDCQAYVGSTFTGSCNTALILYANGRYDLDAAIGSGGSGSSIVEALDQQWCSANGNGGFEPRRYYVAVFKTSGSPLTLSSAAVNTYISLATNSTVLWRLAASQTDSYFDGIVKVSTTSSNTGVVAVANLSLASEAAGIN